MFRNYDGALAQDPRCRSAQTSKHRLILAGSIVWRIQKDNFEIRRRIGTFPAQICDHRAVLDSNAVAQSKLVQVRLEHFQRDMRSLYKDHAPGSPAQRLDPHSARSRIEVQEACALNPWGQDIEKRFAQPVARRPGIQPPGRFERPAPQRSCNDAHRDKNIRVPPPNPEPLQFLYAWLDN